MSEMERRLMPLSWKLSGSSMFRHLLTLSLWIDRSDEQVTSSGHSQIRI